MFERPAVRYAAFLSALFLGCFLAGVNYGTTKARSNYGNVNGSSSHSRSSSRQLRNTSQQEAATSETNAKATTEFEQQSLLHAQCARGNSLPGASNRPLLMLKYSRTGSTWLAWTGSTLRLASTGQPMTWVHEAQGCIRDADGNKYNNVESSTKLSMWFSEYFSRNTNGIMNGREAKHSHIIDHKCLETVGKDPNELGVVVATLNPHVSHDETPDLTPEQWSEIFDASPDLAMGVLVRTNVVKRSISAIASDVQKEICHSKKLHGDEDCIKNLPKTIYVDPKAFMGKIRESERKRTVVMERAAQLSAQYGDGRIFCLSYEGMQNDLTGEMADLGEYLGAPIDPTSLAELEEGSVSYKRGSDDLSDYIENYEEIRNMLASQNPCLLEQLEAKEPRTFPLCGVYTSDEEEKQ